VERILISDIDCSNLKCVVVCEDSHGNIYNFPVSYDDAKLISLLMADAYVPQNSMLDFLIDIFNHTKIKIDYCIIHDGYKNSTFVGINDGTGEIKEMRIPISYAFIFSLALDVPVFVKAQAHFVDFGELCWREFIKDVLYKEIELDNT